MVSYINEATFFYTVCNLSQSSILCVLHACALRTLSCNGTRTVRHMESKHIFYQGRLLGTKLGSTSLPPCPTSLSCLSQFKQADCGSKTKVLVWKTEAGSCPAEASGKSLLIWSWCDRVMANQCKEVSDSIKSNS